LLKNFIQTTKIIWDKMIRKEWVKLIEKYSFIDRSEIKMGCLFLYYTNKGKQLFKKIPIRVIENKLQNTILKIENEIGVSKFGKSRNRIFIG